MTRGRIVVWALWLAAAGLLAHTAAEKEEKHLQEQVHWHTIQELLATAPAKPALVEFDAPWCRPCWEMKFRVYSRKDVANFIEERYFPVRITVENEAELPAQEKNVLQAYGVEGFPTVLVVNSEGQPLQMFTGFLDAERLIQGLLSGENFEYLALPKRELTLEGLREPSPKLAKVVLYPAWALKCLEDREVAFSYQIFYDRIFHLPRPVRNYLVNNFEFFEASPPSVTEALANPKSLCWQFAQAHQVASLPAALVFSPDGKELLAKFAGDVGPLYSFLRASFPNAQEHPEGYLRWTPSQTEFKDMPVKAPAASH